MNYFGGITKNLWLKIIASIPVCFFDFPYENTIIVWGIVFMVILDTVLGVWVAFANRKFRSGVLRRFTEKVGWYSIAMASAWILEVVYPNSLGWTFEGMGFAILLTEFISNLEKLSLLGWTRATMIVARLNDEFVPLLIKKDRKKIVKKLIKS